MSGHVRRQGGDSRTPTLEELAKAVTSLNEDYGLGIPAHDPTLSPRRRQEMVQTDEDRQNLTLRNDLHFLHFRGKLPQCLSQFRCEAAQICQGWIPNRHGDPGILASVSAAPLGARSTERQSALRRSLQDILTRSRLASQPGPPKRLTEESNTGGAARRTRSRASAEAVDRDIRFAIDPIPFRTSQPGGGSTDPHPALAGPISSQEPPGSLSLGSTTDSNRESPDSSVFSSRDDFRESQQTSKNTSFDSLASFLDDDTTTDPGVKTPTPESLCDQLRNIWPFPPGPSLNEAPLAVVWEVTRAAMHCGVDLRDFDFQDGVTDDNTLWWHDQDTLWSRLAQHKLFVGRQLPPKSGRQAWQAAIESFQSHNRVVVLSAEIVAQTSSPRPVFRMKLRPLALQLGHRLDRRFGADRFLEVTMPAPASIKGYGNVAEVTKWLFDDVHFFLGRQWVPFFTRPVPVKPKKSNVRGQIQDTMISTGVTKTEFPVQLLFFAADGNNFRLGPFPPVSDASDPGHRLKLKGVDLLEWVIGLTTSSDQAVPKLFSRISLSLSRTRASVILEKHQIHLMPSDILPRPEYGASKWVMNDGIGRMSRRLAKEVAAMLGLSDSIPCALQGRLGSAKGMWLIDVDDSGDELWIETYKSQRKFECNFDDPHHRTLEVHHSWARQLSSASLNRQLIVILEAQAVNRHKMRQDIADCLTSGLQDDMEQFRAALDDPLQFLDWMQRSGLTSTKDRQSSTHLQFVGGLPSTYAEKVRYLLMNGFSLQMPLVRSYTRKLQKENLESLMTKQKIPVACSTYALMAVDFKGLLEPDEIHLSFSSEFRAGEFSDTLLDGVDALVARSPAHFPSDIRRVRVVFKKELRGLKDVVVFPTKGRRPLADYLSGGDYDGDRAWICWDQKFVENFRNAEPPPEYDFVEEGFLEKETTAFSDLVNSYRGDIEAASRQFLSMAISFNLQPQKLGQCTNFKDKLCYHDGRIDSEAAILISSMLSFLADQAKSGITLTNEKYSEFITERLKKSINLERPEYVKERSDDSWKRTPPEKMHVLDYLRFHITERAVEQAYKALDNLVPEPTSASNGDPDLTSIAHEFEKRNGKTVLRTLERDIAALSREWTDMALQEQSIEYQDKIRILYQKWIDMPPPPDLIESGAADRLSEIWSVYPTMESMATQGTHVWSAPFGPWNLLKASVTFRILFRTRYNFAWDMAGRQLAFIKARIVSSTASLADTAPVLLVPDIYMGMKMDKNAVQAHAARRKQPSDTRDMEFIGGDTDYDSDEMFTDA